MLRVKMLRTWGQYRKGTVFRAQILAVSPDRKVWDLLNHNTSERMIGVPRETFETVEEKEDGLTKE